MHALEIGSAGQVAFATRAEPAWHMLGTVFDKDAKVTTSDMLDLAYLSNWNVTLEDAPLPSDDYEFVAPTYYVVRDNPFEVGRKDILATVGGRYKVVQNEELFAFGDNLLDGGGQWETAGAIKGGRQVFGSLLPGDDIVLDPNGAADRIRPYLLVTTSHDGTVGVQAALTPVRVVCQNTLNYALRGIKQSFKVRHTSTVEGRIAVARETLAISFKHQAAFKAESEALLATRMTSADFVKIATTVYPKPEKDSKAALTRWENKIDLLGDIFNSSVDQSVFNSAPQTNVNIAGTAWAGLNALTERLDWYRKGRGESPQAVIESASGFNPVVNAEKNNIHKIVVEWAKEANAKAFASV